MLETLLQIIETLDTSLLRRTWLAEHYPVVDMAFIANLQQQAHQLERIDNRKAYQIAQLLADAADLWDDRQTLAAALRVEAQSLRGTEPLTALRKYEEAVRIYQSLGLMAQAADAAVGQVAAMRTLGRYSEAFATNRWVIDYFRAHTDDFGLARALLNQGLISYYLGQFQQARGSYQEAQRLFTQLGEAAWSAAVLSNDANVLEELNDYEAAEANYLQARAIYAKAGMSNAVGRVDHNLAYLAYSLGDYQRALRLFGQAREQFRLLENTIDIAYVDLYRTEIYLILNLWHKALELARSTRVHFERAQLPWESAQLVLNEAVALIHLQKYELAQEKLGQARRLFSASGFSHWQALADLYEGHLYFALQEYDAAARMAQQARTLYLQYGLSRRVGQCETLLGQVALAMGKLLPAEEHFAAAKAAVGPYRAPLITYYHHFGLARVFYLQGNIGAAEENFRLAVDAVEEVQTKIGAEDYKIAFLGDKLAVYEQFIQFCLEQRNADYYRRAFDILEQAKLCSIRTLSQTANDSARSRNDLQFAAADVEQLEQLKRQLNRYYAQFYTPEAAFASEEEVARLHRTITHCEQKLSHLLDTQQRLDFAQTATKSLQRTPLPKLQAMLPPKTLLLEYFFSENRLSIFCLQQTHFAVYRVHLTIDYLQDLIQQLNFQLSKFQLGTRFRERHRRLLQDGIDAVLHQLYQLLIAPVASLLNSIDHLIVVPHQHLHNLPFHAFFDGKQYLLERFGLSYAISATFLYTVRHASAQTTYAAPLIVGVNDTLIQQAENEAAVISQIFPEAELCCGADATAERLLNNPQPRAFLHLATHGVFRADNPLFSAIKLADGWLTMQELATLQHSAPLITLSACDTGRSETLFGNPLTDFYRIFFRTGSRSLVVSLWSLDDQAAIKVMSTFYRELRAGVPVYQALRRAQLAMMAHWRHPYYWAPFILTGDPYLHHMQPSLQPLLAETRKTS